MPILLKIADWDDLYEINRTREMKRMKWVPVPCKFDGDGYTELVTRHKNGAAHYAAWMAFLLSAARSEERGTLTRSSGKPHDTETISAITRIPKSVLDEALPRLIKIGWIVSESKQSDAEIQQVSRSLPAGKPQINRSHGQALSAHGGARDSLPFSSLPFFLGKGVKGERGQLPEALESEAFREQLDLWIAYKAERKEGYKPTGFRSMVTHASNMAKQHGIQAVVDAFVRAMANGWKGWDQDSSFKPENKNGKQRTTEHPVGAGQHFDGDDGAPKRYDGGGT